MDRQDVSAVILAGGFSSRMGELKPLLDLAGIPALQRAAQSFRAAGVGDIRVVVGHEAEKLDPLLSSLGLRRVLNRDYRLGMFASIQAGVRSLEDTVGGFFLLPADIPLVRPSTYRRLLAARERTGAPIVYPVFDSRRGHPPLIDTRYAREISGADPAGNLRSILEKHEDEALEVECADAAIHWDIDTREDYERMRLRARRLDIPSEEECLSLLRIHGVPDPVVRHGRAVAALGKRMAEAVASDGDAHPDIDAIVAAGILHDIAKGRRDHASVGAALLREEGFPRVAEIVGAHMDLGPSRGEPSALTEKEIVYLADKLVREDRIVSLDERFCRALEKAGGEGAVAEKIRERRETALRLLERVDTLAAAAGHDASYRQAGT